MSEDEDYAELPLPPPPAPAADAKQHSTAGPAVQPSGTEGAQWWILAVAVAAAAASALAHRYTRLSCADPGTFYSFEHAGCVPECLVGFYPRQQLLGNVQVCSECNAECWEGCRGPSVADCVACRHYRLAGVCIARCPPGTFADDQYDCIPEELSATSVWLAGVGLKQLSSQFFEQQITISALPAVLAGKGGANIRLSAGQRMKLEQEVQKLVDTGRMRALHTRRYAAFIEMTELLDVKLGVITDASDGAAQKKLGGRARNKPACQFSSGRDFVAAIEETAQLQEMHSALCTHCTFREYRERGANCALAKKLFRELSKTFHPDRVGRVFPHCGTLDLEVAATNAMMNATLVINKYCRRGGR